MSCRSKKEFVIDIDDIVLFDAWKISKKTFEHPSEIDKVRYDSLIELGFDNWPPVIVIPSEEFPGKWLLFDGYHRVAIAKYLLHENKLKACV